MEKESFLPTGMEERGTSQDDVSGLCTEVEMIENINLILQAMASEGVDGDWASLSRMDNERGSSSVVWG